MQHDGSPGEAESKSSRGCLLPGAMADNCSLVVLNLAGLVVNRRASAYTVMDTGWKRSGTEYPNQIPVELLLRVGFNRMRFDVAVIQFNGE